MQAIDKRQANEYDRMIDAASDLADLIDEGGIEMDEYVLEELTIFLASNADEVKKIFRNLKYDEFVKSLKTDVNVIPDKAGIQ